MDIHVRGEDFGHRARREKPKATERWDCRCFDHPTRLNSKKSNPPYLLNCPVCWAKRPY